MIRTTVLAVLAIVVGSACAAPPPEHRHAPPLRLPASLPTGQPADDHEPACEVSDIQHDDRLTMTVTGTCSEHGRLRGGAVTADNQALVFVQVPVGCPFSVTASFEAPAPDVDWSYVLHLEDSRIPGVTECTVSEP